MTNCTICGKSNEKLHLHKLNNKDAAICPFCVKEWAEIIKDFVANDLTPISELEK